MRYILLVALTLITAMPANARNWTGTVVGYGVDVLLGNNFALVRLADPVPGGAPPCATETTQMALNLDSSKNYALLDMIMLAKATGQSVTLIGSGNTCVQNREEVVSVSIGF